MERPLRTEYPGAFYHIISRGNARQKIFLSDADKKGSLPDFMETSFLLEQFDTRERATCR